MDKKTSRPAEPPTTTDGPSPRPRKARSAKKGESTRPPRSEASATAESDADDGPERQVESAPFSVVGIGASAGGLEPLQKLLAGLPTDTGMAFVLVSHLDPTRESFLAEILSRSTEMPVHVVEDQMRVEPDRVYVMPPAVHVTIKRGILTLLPRKNFAARRYPIDHFLRALAEDQGDRSLGVVLSGFDTDGTLGLEAIKAEGGITFVQDESAKFDSMPHSAIAAGVVDFVLPPEQIAKELAHIARHPYQISTHAAPAGEPKPEDAKSLERIVKALSRATGVDFSSYKPSTLQRRIARRMVLHRMDGFEPYASYLRNQPTEVEALYGDLLIGVTKFFRDPAAFEALKARVLPEIVRTRAADEPVRVWVLGCSTGEEVYSIAILVSEVIGEAATHVPVQIYATDINEASIEKARAGLYAKSIAADVTPGRLQRFFVETESGYRISKPLRDMCVFARHNALSDPPFSRMDLISCRNLMIYLEPAVQKRVIPTLHYALKPNGFLLLGASETVGAFTDLFDAVDKKHKIYSKRPGSARKGFHFSGSLLASENPSVGPKPASVGDGAGSSLDAQREADRIVLTKYAPAGVLVDANLEVVQFRGSTGQYLEPPPGKASFNVLKMARDGLLVPLRTAIQRAKKEGTPARSDGVRVKFDDRSVEVTVEVIPVRVPSGDERSFLILFTPAAEPKPSRATPGKERGGAKQRETATHRVARLEQELVVTREYLQSVIEQYEAANEELQSAGEEIQSGNEELQSINEELETAKEELQSSNEELTTVNDELQNRNLALTHLNDDLARSHDQIKEALDYAKAIVETVQSPLLVLDAQLRVVTANPAFYEAFQVKEGEAEHRSIFDLDDGKWNNPELRRLLEDVLPGNNAVRGFQAEQEFPSLGLRTILVNARRLVQESGHEAKVLLSIEDVTERARLHAEAVEAREAAEAANHIKDLFLATVSHELRTPLNAILGWSHILSTGTPSAESRARGLEVIARSATAQVRIIDDLMDVSRIISGKFQMDWDSVSLVPTIKAAVDEIRPAADVKGVALDVTLPSTTIIVRGDSVRLRQVIWNLTSNAIKFTPAGGRVEVRLEAASDGATITVCDSGRGISDELLPYVFDWFRQAEGGPKRAHQGLGLGLAISRRLVELHRGTIRAESQGVGKGAVFTVTLPIATEPQEPVALNQAAVGTVPSLGGARLLVVDDNEDVREMLALTLTRYDAEVRTCTSAAEGFAAAKEWQPDVVISDIGMPGEDGYDLMRQVRALGPEHGGSVPSIALTGYASVEDQGLAFGAGFDLHLAKPVDLPKLAEAIARLLGLGDAPGESKK